MVLVLTMKIFFFLTALAGIAVIWRLEHTAAAELSAEVASLRLEKSKLAAARREHETLRQLQTETALRATQHSHPANHEPRAAANPAIRTALVLGEWCSPKTWQNRGQLTPTATIETALWAAAGGDLAVLQSLVYFDDALRAKAEALHSQLPEAARIAYQNPEHLLAAFATKSLPLGDAQLVWSHQPDQDEAFACLFVKNPEYVPPSHSADSLLLEKNSPPESRAAAIARAAATAEARKKEKRPPMAPSNDASRALYLVLRNTVSGWQLVVSPGTMDRIAKEISGLNDFRL
jgi:hypothetical protein